MGVAPEVTSGAAQHIGARRNQQDTIDVTAVPGTGVLAILCDGMGGMDDGQLASETAVAAFRECFLTRGSLEEALLVANAAVCALLRKTGTTLIAAHVTATCFEWISVGDSPLYLLHAGSLRQLNTPHIYANRLSAAEAAIHPERDSLTSFVGIPVLSEIDRSPAPITLDSGDRVVLASDGLSRALQPDEIAAHIHTGAQQSCDTLIHTVLARKRHGQDNVSVITVFTGQDENPLPLPAREAKQPVQRGNYGRIVLLFLALAAAGIVWHFLQPQSPVPAVLNPAHAHTGAQD